MRHHRAEVVPRALQSASAPGHSNGWIAFILSVLLAFTWQSFVTQTHEHFDSAAFASAAGAKATAPHSQSGRPPANPADSCPICRAIAQVGHYLLPTAVSVEILATNTHWLTVTEPLALALRQRSHAWRSRAPPTPSEA